MKLFKILKTAGIISFISLMSGCFFPTPPANPINTAFNSTAVKNYLENQYEAYAFKQLHTYTELDSMGDGVPVITNQRDITYVYSTEPSFGIPVEGTYSTSDDEFYDNFEKMYDYGTCLPQMLEILPENSLLHFRTCYAWVITIVTTDELTIDQQVNLCNNFEYIFNEHGFKEVDLKIYSNVSQDAYNSFKKHTHDYDGYSVFLEEPHESYLLGKKADINNYDYDYVWVCVGSTDTARVIDCIVKRNGVRYDVMFYPEYYEYNKQQYDVQIAGEWYKAIEHESGASTGQAFVYPYVDTSMYTN